MFTHEIEDETGKIPFLDINIQRMENNQLEFSIFRKPTTTSRYIPSNSYHSIQHKKAAFNSMIHRLLNIPMNEINYTHELQNIFSIAEKNGYDEDFIIGIYKKMRKQHEWKLKTTHKKEKSERKYLSIEYAPIFTNRIKSIFKKQNIELVTKSSNKLSTLTCKQKDRTERMDKSGVYEIKCSNCNKKYIGQTRRKLKTRFKEHYSAIKNKGESAVADHMRENDHTFTQNNMNLLHQCYDRRRLDVLESIEIYRAEGEIMNGENGPIQSSLFKYTKKTN